MTTVLFLTLASIVSCNNSEKENPQANNSLENGTYQPSSIIRSIGETEIENYKQYDFYIFYFFHRPWYMSRGVSLRVQDSIIYSYTKYMDNVASTNYPPINYLKNKDSVYYTVIYKEHEYNLLNKILKTIKSDLNEYKNASKESINHNSKVLFIYHKDFGILRATNWSDSSSIAHNLIPILESEIMNYSE